MNRTSIKQFLSERGIFPKQERGNYGMYLSPLRDERTASFKVDYDKNVWYDFGAGKGGSFVDLIMVMERCDLYTAAEKLKNDSSFLFHRTQPTHSANSTLQIVSVQPLQDSRLIDYLQSKRSINLGIAREYCQEVHYTTNGKNFFAIGFQSDGGGWELRNEYFKGGTSPKGITTIGNNSPTCLLFEGFMDMLSYLTLKKETTLTVDIIILNSVNNLNKAIDFLKRHQTIHCFLDNDEAGKRTVTEVQKLDYETIDHSPSYHQHKDLNEYLCQKKLAQKEPIKSRGMRR